jgi:hypothetical protein
MTPRPRPEQAAAAVADCVVVAADDLARSASPSYWNHAAHWRDPVVAATGSLVDHRLRTLVDRLTATPTAAEPYYRLRAALAADVSSPSGEVGALLAAGWRADGMSRLGYHIGRRYRCDHGGPEPYLASLPDPVRRPTTAGDPVVLVVVPFRDSSVEPIRLRNVLATLRALADQSMPRADYHITVVESDARARWRDGLEPLVDTYLFAPKDGPFNKAWTVNVGVVGSPVRPDLVCVLDADILVDRNFLRRNALRFARGGVGAVLPYRDVLYLDPTSTRHAINDRCVLGAAVIDRDPLRGFLLRCPWGGCVWLRAELFHRVGGMDERFEGWGGEDDDFTIRLGLWAALDRSADTLLHLAHPPAVAELRDGVPTNGPANRQFWPTRTIGVIDRYSGTDDPPETQ